KIDLVGNALKAENFHYLCEFPKLERLELGRCSINAECLKNMGNCKTLNHLNVSFNPKVDDAAIKHLAGMKNIQHLDLVETAVTPKGLMQL
ncbi:hypothetical protein, partial [Klebsiella pneumoniae]|uniref:hypothetical protein n=1 Tax=Klebsiella pneumoniae TaxID=573 RepID=UPI003B98066D